MGAFRWNANEKLRHLFYQAKHSYGMPMGFYKMKSRNEILILKLLLNLPRLRTIKQNKTL